LRQEKTGDKNLILGIESSFDDSCAGVVEGSGKVLANEINRFKTNLSQKE
jgi:tRNA A37 threonylcarbamoyltransferase TsaD